MTEYDLRFHGNFSVSPIDQFARLHTRFSAQESTWMLFGSVVSLGQLTECSTEFIVSTIMGGVLEVKCLYVVVIMAKWHFQEVSFFWDCLFSVCRSWTMKQLIHSWIHFLSPCSLFPCLPSWGSWGKAAKHGSSNLA